MKIGDADLAMRERLSPAAIRVTGRIADRWKLSSEALGLILGLDTGSDEGDSKLLSSDQLYRAGLLISIYQALLHLFAVAEADEWGWKKNSLPQLRGIAPIVAMQTGGTHAMSEILEALRVAQFGGSDDRDILGGED